MLTRYYDLKKELVLNDKAVRDFTIEVSQQRTTVNKLEEHIREKKKDTDLQIEKECKRILDKKLAKEESNYQYDERLLEQFKSEELKLLAEVKYKIDTNNVIESGSYDESKKIIEDVYNSISSKILKYVDNTRLEAFRNVGYGFDLVKVDPKHLSDMLEYFSKYDDYDHLSRGVAAVDKSYTKLDNNTVVVISVAVLAVLYTFKMLLIIPYLLFIIASLVIRIREYYYLISLINAHIMLQDKNVLLGENYYKTVDAHILVEESRLIDCKLFLEQLCNKVNEGITTKKSIALKNIEKSFDMDEARKEAMTAVADTTEKTMETLEEEKEMLISKEKELQDMIDTREENRNRIVSLKEEIKNVYEQLMPSFKETSLLSEFFLGFDDKDEPVTFNYGSSTTLILYDGSLEGQIGAVMSTLKMMCGQIMCSMYPLAYSISIVDTLTSGAPLSAFQVTGEGDFLDTSNLFEVISTNSDTTKFIDELYFMLQTRRVKVLGQYMNIEEYNDEKRSFGAKTMPYKLAFFYHFDYKLVHTNDKLKQICRLSEILGIIPIFFMDMDNIGEEDRSLDHNKLDNKKYEYKTEVVMDTLGLFKGNTFGFTITDSVDIVKLSNSDIKDLFRRN